MCYLKAKQALHTALPEKIVGRVTEQEVVNDFLTDHLVEGQPGSLYISGAPGTGKTAILKHKIQNFKVRIDPIHLLYRKTYTVCTLYYLLALSYLVTFPFQDDCDYITSYINCMSLKNSQAIYNKILNHVLEKESSVPIKQCVQQLEKCFSESGPMM